MPERPKIYHGFYVTASINGDLLSFITFKHPLDVALAANYTIINWNQISGLQEDFDRWGARVEVFDQ